MGAALVDGVAADSVSAQLVNLHPSEPREVIVQAGMFAEHEFTTVESEGSSVQVNAREMTVRLRPGALAQLKIGMKRWAHQPTYAFPWHERRVR